MAQPEICYAPYNWEEKIGNMVRIDPRFYNPAKGFVIYIDFIT